jgi:sec-independent protein translocase protein TatA
MMFKNFGLPELLIVLVLALIIFGPGRVARLGSELGKGIREFRSGLREDIESESDEEEEQA